jgi:glycosyltransferase involved in cell wall biosynthesis
VFDLATHLPESEFDVAVLCGESGALVEKLRAAEVRTITIPSLSRDVSLLRDVRSFFLLFRILTAERPDIVHLNSSKAGALGALTARFLGVPRIVFTVHGWPFLEHRNIFSQGLIRLVSWLSALLAHTVIVVSDYDAVLARIMPFVGKKTVRIYNGIGEIALGTGQKIRGEFPKGVHILGTIGELTANKNQIELIVQAEKDPSLFVAIVGEGELHTALDAAIRARGLEERVKLFGFVEARDALPGFDEFILPSEKEGLPYALLEARRAGLPVTAHPVGGVREALEKPLSEFTLAKMIVETLGVYRGR